MNAGGPLGFRRFLQGLGQSESEMKDFYFFAAVVLLAWQSDRVVSYLKVY